MAAAPPEAAAAAGAAAAVAAVPPPPAASAAAPTAAPPAAASLGAPPAVAAPVDAAPAVAAALDVAPAAAAPAAAGADAVGDAAAGAFAAGGARFDEDGVRERADVLLSEQRRRERERAARKEHASKQDQIRAEFASGRMPMAEFARVAREAGIPVSEVTKALRERATADKLAAHTASVAAAAQKEAEVAAECSNDWSLLTAAKAAKAQGLERLKRGDTASAAEAFADAASLAYRAASEIPAEAAESAAQDVALLRESSLLNEALCRLKLGEWEATIAACTTVLTGMTDSAKARYRRAQARRNLGQLEAAREDLAVAAALEPNDREVRRAYAELRDELRAARARAMDLKRAEQRRCMVGIGGDGALLSERGESASISRDGDGEFGGNDISAGGGATTLDDSASVGGAEVDVNRRTYVHMSFAVDGEVVAKLIIQLFDDLVPITTANFRAFCRGEVQMGGERRGYTGCAVHRIVKGFVVQTGDVISGDGSGCVSAVGNGGPFRDESFAVPHRRAGILSMANMGKNSNGCQFFFTLAPAAELDQKHVAFGRVLQGLDGLRRLEVLPTDDAERPFQNVTVNACGDLSVEEVSKVSRESAANDDVFGDHAMPGGGIDMGGEAMVAAARQSDLRLMRALVEKGVPVDALGSVDDEGLSPGEPVERSALCVAANRGDIPLIQALLAANADPSLHDSAGMSPLHLAVRCRSCDATRVLLEAKADVSARSADGKAAVHWAAAGGALDCLRLLLAYDNGQREVECNGLTPMHLASAADDAASILVLVDVGARTSCLAAGELSPLHLAAAQGKLSAMATLIASGAEVDLRAQRSGKTALLRACEHGRAAAAAALLAAKADAHAIDSRGSTSMHWAAKAGSHQTVAALLAARVAPHVASKAGTQPLHLACESGSAHTVALLLSARATGDVPDSNGVTPLHAASASGHTDCVNLLLANHADPNVALHIRGRLQISGAEDEEHSKSPLYLAAEKGHTTVVKALLAANADVHALAVTTSSSAISRTSALWAAMRAHHEDVVDLLIGAGGSEVAETIATTSVKCE